MLRLLWAALIIYVIFVVIIIVNQNRLTYFPSRGQEDALREVASRNGLEPWADRSGRLIGWKAVPIQPASRPRNRVVLFHGNGGMALDRADVVRGLRNLDTGKLWEIYLFEYPGYGARPGNPGEKVIVTSAIRAISELRDSDSRPLFLIGESLGSGVASQVAASMPGDIAGLFLITPFTSLTDVAAHHYSLVPVRLVLREHYNNTAALASYHGPVAFLFAGHDEVVPSELGRKLYDSYGGPKKSWTQDTARHNTLSYGPSTSLWREVSEFLLGEGEDQPPR